MVFLKSLSLLLLILLSSNALAQQSDPLKIAVASNFKLSLEKLAKEFSEETGQEIQIISGSSGALAQQISLGANIDIFMSADTQRPMWLEQQGLTIKNSRFTYASGQLVLSGKALNTQLSAQENLQGSKKLTLAIANPLLAPYGKAAEECLKHWQLQDNYKIIKANNINQTFHYIISNNVDLGFIALAQAKQKNIAYVVINKNCHQVIEQQALLIKKNKPHRNSIAFMQFLKSEAAKKIIKKAGYQP